MAELKYPAKLGAANKTSTGYPIVDLKEVAGHRQVATLSDLYAIFDYILSQSGDNTNNDAIGQEWYVVATDTKYKLINWANRHSASGWKIVEYSKVTCNDNSATITETTSNGVRSYDISVPVPSMPATTQRITLSSSDISAGTKTIDFTDTEGFIIETYDYSVIDEDFVFVASGTIDYDTIYKFQFPYGAKVLLLKDSNNVTLIDSSSDYPSGIYTGEVIEATPQTAPTLWTLQKDITNISSDHSINIVPVANTKGYDYTVNNPIHKIYVSTAKEFNEAVYTLQSSTKSVKEICLTKSFYLDDFTKIASSSRHSLYTIEDYDNNGYSQLFVAPSDFTSNYGNYYKIVNKKYTALTASETFATGTYYQKFTKYVLLASEPTDFSTSYNLYYKIVNNNYVALTQAETFVANTYYKNIYDLVALSIAPDDFTANYSKYYKKVDSNYFLLTEAETFVSGTYYERSNCNCVVNYNTKLNDIIITSYDSLRGFIHYQEDKEKFYSIKSDTLNLKDLVLSGVRSASVVGASSMVKTIQPPIIIGYSFKAYNCLFYTLACDDTNTNYIERSFVDYINSSNNWGTIQVTNCTWRSCGGATPPYYSQNSVIINNSASSSNGRIFWLFIENNVLPVQTCSRDTYAELRIICQMSSRTQKAMMTAQDFLYIPAVADDKSSTIDDQISHTKYNYHLTATVADITNLTH